MKMVTRRFPDAGVAESPAPPLLPRTLPGILYQDYKEFSRTSDFNNSTGRFLKERAGGIALTLNFSRFRVGYLLIGCEPVRTIRYGDLKPCTSSKFTVLIYGYSGNREDLPNKE